MPSGIIIIDKPSGWTSMDVCAKLRGVLQERRVGHAGTLDPMATGVLPVFVGRATRAVEFAGEGRKEYTAGLRLGTVTTTQDTSGEVLDKRPVTVSRPEVEAALAAFRGELMQLPPMYSAVKVHGQRLYALARKGREVERKPRPVTIYELELLEQTGETDYRLRCVCSKGTYLRTLCHDLGAALGCGGCMYELRRTMAAGFTLREAVPIEAAAETALLPVDAYFARAGWTARVTVRPGPEKTLRNGGTVSAHGEPLRCRVYAGSGEFLGIGERSGGQLRLIKSFFEV